MACSELRRSLSLALLEVMALLAVMDLLALSLVGFYMPGI
jgi:hypothetical protein